MSMKQGLFRGLRKSKVRFIAFGSRRRQTAAPSMVRRLPQTHPGAHVAPQRCTILRDGKAKSIYHSFFNFICHYLKLSLTKGTPHRFLSRYIYIIHSLLFIIYYLFFIFYPPTPHFSFSFFYLIFLYFFRKNLGSRPNIGLTFAVKSGTISIGILRLIVTNFPHPSGFPRYPPPGEIRTRDFQK